VPQRFLCGFQGSYPLQLPYVEEGSCLMRHRKKSIGQVIGTSGNVIWNSKSCHILCRTTVVLHDLYEEKSSGDKGHPCLTTTVDSWLVSPFLGVQADSRTHVRGRGATLMPPRYLYLDLPKHVMRNVCRFHLHAHALAMDFSIWRGGNCHCDKCFLRQVVPLCKM